MSHVIPYLAQWLQGLNNPNAAGGVTSFNGRFGAVTSQASDYTGIYDVSGTAATAVANHAAAADPHPLYTTLAEVNAAIALALGGGGLVVSVFGRSGAVTAQAGDYSAFYADIAHAHTFASLTSKPTTLAGYGITDAAASGHTHAFSSLTGLPTTLAGYGITDAASSGHTHSNATTGAAGFMSDVDKAKLNGIEAGATADMTPAEIVAAVNANLGGTTWQGGGGGGGGGVLKGTAAVTPVGFGYEAEATVTVTGAAAGMVVMVSVAPHDDADENHESMLAIAALRGTAGTDQVTLFAAFSEPTAGPVKLSYMVA